MRDCPVCGNAGSSPAHQHQGDPHVGQVTVVACDSCGAMYQDPAPAHVAYEGQAPGGRLARVQKEYRALREIGWLRARMDLATPRSMLDIGAGTGSLAWTFAQEGWDAALVELDDSQRAFARDTYGLAPHASLEDVPADTPRALITIVQMLEHVEEPLALLQHVRTMLDDGGALYVAVPNLAQPNESEPDDYFHGDHLTWFGADQLRHLLERAGFAVSHLTEGQWLRALAHPAENAAKPSLPTSRPTPPFHPSKRSALRLAGRVRDASLVILGPRRTYRLIHPG